MDYQVQVNEYVWHRHADQLRTKHPSVEQASESVGMPHISESLEGDSGLDESPQLPDVPLRQSFSSTEAPAAVDSHAQRTTTDSDSSSIPSSSRTTSSLIPSSSTTQSSTQTMKRAEQSTQETTCVETKPPERVSSSSGVETNSPARVEASSRSSSGEGTGKHRLYPLRQRKATDRLNL